MSFILSKCSPKSTQDETFLWKERIMMRYSSTLHLRVPFQWLVFTQDGSHATVIAYTQISSPRNSQGADRGEGPALTHGALRSYVKCHELEWPHNLAFACWVGGEGGRRQPALAQAGRLGCSSNLPGGC